MKRYTGRGLEGSQAQAGASVFGLGVCHPPSVDVFTHLETHRAPYYLHLMEAFW